MGVNVRYLRKTSGLTQKQLAEKLRLLGYEFDRLTIGRIENGERFVADYEVKGLATALKVSLDRLYSDEK